MELKYVELDNTDNTNNTKKNPLDGKCFMSIK